MFKKILFVSILISLSSCGGDDDICLSGESTPRLKLKFQDIQGQFIQLDSLYINVDYGKSEPTEVVVASKIDSVFVPLRVDDNPFTDIYVKTQKDGAVSKVRINYQSNAIYVSPACGFKKNYDNLNAELLQSLPIKQVELNNSSLTNEDKTNFYLRF